MRTLSGTVVNSATDEPIPRALVLTFSNPPAAVMTGPDGHFDLPNVPANSAFSIRAQKPGYGMTNGGQLVAPGENNITIKLAPQGGIQGHILDDQGRPLQGIQVQAIAERIMNGRKRENLNSSASTDENGAYELDGLLAGNYLVKTVLHRLYWTAAPLPAAQQAYPGEYYPDAPDRAGAQPVNVMPGQTAEADFSLTPVRTYRISGVLAGAGENPGSLMLKRPSGETLAIPRRFNRRTGRFLFLSVPAGSYKLKFRSYPKPGADAVYAARRLNVDDDITGLQIAPQPLAAIPVTIVRPTAADNGSGLPYTSPTNVQVQLIAPDESNTSYSAIARQSSTPDSLKIRNVPPGSYHVAVHTFGPECLDTITSGATDLSSENPIVSAGAAPQPITVTLRNDCATLSGTVRTAGRTAPAVVLLVPESGANEPRLMGVGSKDGQFRIVGLRPGTYRVYAFSTILGLEYTNPDALRDFDAQEITLNANEKANVTLDLIVRGEQ